MKPNIKILPKVIGMRPNIMLFPKEIDFRLGDKIILDDASLDEGHEV